MSGALSEKSQEEIKINTSVTTCPCDFAKNLQFDTGAGTVLFPIPKLKPFYHQKLKTLYVSVCNGQKQYIGVRALYLFLMAYTGCAGGLGLVPRI